MLTTEELYTLSEEEMAAMFDAGNPNVELIVGKLKQIRERLEVVRSSGLVIEAALATHEKFFEQIIARAMLRAIDHPDAEKKNPMAAALLAAGRQAYYERPYWKGNPEEVEATKTSRRLLAEYFNKKGLRDLYEAALETFGPFTSSEKKKTSSFFQKTRALRRKARNLVLFLPILSLKLYMENLKEISRLPQNEEADKTPIDKSF